MPEEAKKDDLIDVGEADEKATEINLDDQGEPEKTEAPKEEKIEVEEVAQPEEKKEGGEVEVKEETKEEKKDEKKEELEKYSEGVQKRISKLTRKKREAERQKEEAVVYAQSVNRDKEDLESKFSRLDKSYVSEFESRVKTNMKAAKQALKTAIESQNVEGQVTAQEQIATLTMDAARLNALKAAEIAKPKEKDVNITPQQTRPHVAPDPMAEDWATKNTWFGNNSAMTYPKSNDYYSEVDKRIRL